MPWIKVQERHQEVKADCSSSGDDKVGEDVVSQLEFVGGFLELDDDNVDTCECIIRHYYRVYYHGSKIEFLRTLRTVTHAKDELRADKKDERVAEEDEEVEAYVVSEWVNGGVRERASDEVEGQVEVGQGKVGEGEINSLVAEFDV